MAAAQNRASKPTPRSIDFIANYETRQRREPGGPGAAGWRPCPRAGRFRVPRRPWRLRASALSRWAASATLP